MKTAEVRHKIFLSILNVLLVAGAILSIVTIDGGKWIPLYLTFVSSSQVLDQSTQVQSIDTNAGVKPAVKATPQGQDACVVVSQLLNPDWYNTYQLVNTYNQADNGSSRPADGAANGAADGAATGADKQVICEK